MKMIMMRCIHSYECSTSSSRSVPPRALPLRAAEQRYQKQQRLTGSYMDKWWSSNIRLFPSHSIQVPLLIADCTGTTHQVIGR